MSQQIQFPAPGPNSYVLVAVGFSVTTSSVASMSCGSGTFTQVAALNSAGKRIELWVGYGFGTTATSTLTITRTAGSATWTAVVRTIDVAGSAAALTNLAASSGNTATSTSADSGSLTPAVGDILFTGMANAGTTGSSARTHTGNTYRDNVSTSIGANRIETGWGEATAAVPSSEVWTIPSAEWVAIQAKWSPGTQTPSAAILVKGMATAAADLASPY